MLVLVACEESQRTTIEFRKLGHIAFSCDILEPSGGHPEWHIKQDVLPLLNGTCSFTTMNGVTHFVNDGWDLIIAHPPCTYLTVSGNAWFNIEKYGDKARERIKLREEAYDFFMKFVNANCDKIAIENPVGYMNSHYRKPDQIIQPYMFGDRARKKTCLWLKGLPLLKPTDMVDCGEIGGNGYSIEAGMYGLKDENGKSLRYNDPRTAIIRSKTFPGIAKAFAEQWGNFNEDR